MQFTVSSLLLAALPLALADIKVVSPGPAASVPGTSALTITIADGGAQPPLTALGQAQAFLIAGGNQEGTDTMTVATGTMAAISGNSLTLTIPSLSAGPSTGTTNAFYLKIVSTPSSGGSQVINYSNRFTVTGLTGAWKSTAMQQAAAAAAANPANVPQAQGTTGGSGNNAAAAGGAQQSAAGSDVGDPHPTGTWLPYSMQTTGNVKMAPMQGKPGTKITQTNTAPQFASFAWSVFTTMAPIPIWITTHTASGTMAPAISVENTQAAAAAPTGGHADMERWLNRWKD